jgi:hypothetical protein
MVSNIGLLSASHYIYSHGHNNCTTTITPTTGYCIDNTASIPCTQGVAIRADRCRNKNHWKTVVHHHKMTHGSRGLGIQSSTSWLFSHGPQGLLSQQRKSPVHHRRKNDDDDNVLLLLMDSGNDNIVPLLALLVEFC